MKLTQQELLDYAHWRFRLAEDARKEGKYDILDIVPDCVLEAWHNHGLEPSIRAVVQRGLFSDST